MLHLPPTISSTHIFREDLLAGLSKEQKTTGSPMHLYDDLGSDLYVEITRLPNYYLTRADEEIFRQHAARMAKQFCKDVESLCLLELGVGDGHKTRPLIEACCTNNVDCLYIANDVCGTAANKALAQYNDHSVTTVPVIGCYEEALTYLDKDSGTSRKVVLFLGSTLGNMTPTEQIHFLLLIRQHLQPNDLLLLGIDTKHHDRKPALVIEAAYRDDITAKFIMNILTRANHELNADFDINNFTYHASYNAGTACVEMWLISDHQQSVTIDNHLFTFEPGEALLVERSHKFSRFDIEHLAKQTSFQVQTYLAAPNDFFLNVILRAT